MLSIAIWLLDSSKLGQLAMSVRQATLWSWSNKVAQLCCLSHMGLSVSVVAHVTRFQPMAQLSVFRDGITKHTDC